MFVIDTNLLLFAVNPDSPDHERARTLLEEWRRGPRSWFVTWGIVYDFLRVSTHPKVFVDPLQLEVAWAWIGTLLGDPRSGLLTETERHLEIVTELVGEFPRLRGNPVHDFHTVALMKEHGIDEIRTADTDFHQFGFLEVVNPL